MHLNYLVSLIIVIIFSACHSSGLGYGGMGDLLPDASLTVRAL